mgnify:CR=1 FL=1
MTSARVVSRSASRSSPSAPYWSTLASRLVTKVARDDGVAAAPAAFATAGVLVSMLSHVAAHRYGFEAHGISADSLRTAMARILYTAVTGKKAPA